MRAEHFEPWNKYEQDLEIGFLPKFLSGKLKDLCHAHVMELDAEYGYSKEPTPFSERKNLDWKPIRVGEPWAHENFGCAWFHLTGRLPENIDRRGLYLEFADDGEGLLVDKNGAAVKGFTAGSPVFGVVDDSVEKRYHPLDGFIDEQGNVDIYIDAASNSLLGEFTFDAARLKAAAVVREDRQMLDIYYDFDTLLDYIKGVDYDDPRKLTIIRGLRKVANLINYQDPNAYEKSKKITAELLALPGEEMLNTTAVAHAHLDLAWLWPIRESKRKAKRTFSNLIDMAKQYPDFHFVVSQPQQLAWMKNEEPALYHELRELAKKGQMEPIGGAWVENDTNLPGEESLTRQMLYGQKFWKEEFGHYVRTGWLPDAFGYSGAFPQVLKLAGQDSFMTIKISWSNRTLFPYNTFWWAGIDGTEVVTHMPPEGNYNSVAGPQALLNGKRGIKKDDPQDRMMMVYGVGDGGGGPSETSAERCIRTASVPYLPKVKMGTAQGYFDDLADLKLPRYSGEMYLEKHRGTYTSQSNNKNNNRIFEERMLALEMLLACRGQTGERERMDELWKEALLYQFHDIIPGSSIKRVYSETDQRYEVMLGELENLAQEAGVSFVPGKQLINPGQESVLQLHKMDDRYLLYRGNYRLLEPKILSEASKKNGVLQKVETSAYKVEFAPDGSFRSISLCDGSVIARNANRLRVFIDLGDAWDFEDDYRDQPEQYMELTDTKTRDFGDLIEVRQHYTYKNSSLIQTIVMLRDDPCIRIEHEIDWRDTGYMVRAEFQPENWSDTVHSDIQFGYLDRPTTDNTAHEAAQFEMCCQKWLDLSGENAGFAILNNAKNGFMAKQGILSLNLLRSTSYPCVDGDQEHTCYSYALYPHDGGFDPVRVDDMARQFTARYLFGDVEAEMPGMDSEQISITAFKPAYDGDGYILRAFERTGREACTELTLPTGFELVCETDLLEDRVADVEGGTLIFKPFQIRSFRVRKIR